MRGRFDHSETVPNTFNRRNFRARAAPLNLRCLFAIRAPDISRGDGLLRDDPTRNRKHVSGGRSKRVADQGFTDAFDF